MSFYVIDWIYK